MGDLCGVCGGGHLRQGNHGNNVDKVRLVRLSTKQLFC